MITVLLVCTSSVALRVARVTPVAFLCVPFQDAKVFDWTAWAVVFNAMATILWLCTGRFAL